MMNGNYATLWAPQMGPQVTAIRRTWVDELFFGGARGGGKSDFLLGDFAQDIGRYGRAWQGVLFRRTYPELEELIRRSWAVYPVAGGEWHEQAKEWRFANGACLRMRYLERDADASRYQGHQYTWIGWDELTQWPSDAPYRMLLACLRSADDVPTKRVRSSGNPGGPGHQWVKDRFVDAFPLGDELVEDPRTGMRRMFIRSRVEDNHVLLAHDPNYIRRLEGVGSPELVRAWLEGDWNVVLGAYFPEFSIARHVIRPFTIPDYWMRFRAMDWGSARPFSVGWYAVSDGTQPAIPKGCLVKYREWYGSSGQPNEGLKLTAEEVATGIAERESADPKDQYGRQVSYGVLDPNTFNQDGGPSIAERMARCDARVIFMPADNKRVGIGGHMGGWDQVRARLKGDADGPQILFFSTCRDTIRTLPALQHDDKRPEDVDSEGEDHAGDETRYACMSRPYTVGATIHPERRTITVGGESTVTMNDLWAAKGRVEKRL